MIWRVSVLFLIAVLCCAAESEPLSPNFIRTTTSVTNGQYISIQPTTAISIYAITIIGTTDVLQASVTDFTSTNNIRLYLQQNVPPTVSSYYQRVVSNGFITSITIRYPSAGVWYIGVSTIRTGSTDSAMLSVYAPTWAVLPTNFTSSFGGALVTRVDPLTNTWGIQPLNAAAVQFNLYLAVNGLYGDGSIALSDAVTGNVLQKWTSNNPGDMMYHVLSESNHPLILFANLPSGSGGFNFTYFACSSYISSAIGTLNNMQANPLGYAVLHVPEAGNYVMASACSSSSSYWVYLQEGGLPDVVNGLYNSATYVSSVSWGTLLSASQSGVYGVAVQGLSDRSVSSKLLFGRMYTLTTTPQYLTLSDNGSYAFGSFNAGSLVGSFTVYCSPSCLVYLSRTMMPAPCRYTELGVGQATISTVTSGTYYVTLVGSTNNGNLTVYVTTSFDPSPIIDLLGDGNVWKIIIGVLVAAIAGPVLLVICIRRRVKAWLERRRLKKMGFYQSSLTAPLTISAPLTRPPAAVIGSITPAASTAPSKKVNRGVAGDVQPNTIPMDPISVYPYSQPTHADPYATGTDPYTTGADPYTTGADPYATGTDPYAYQPSAAYPDAVHAPPVFNDPTLSPPPPLAQTGDGSIPDPQYTLPSAPRWTVNLDQPPPL